MATIETDPMFLKPCDNSTCRRKVSGNVAWCCPSCALADTKKYEIHESGPLGHSDSCNERHAIRSPEKHRTGPVPPKATREQVENLARLPDPGKVRVSGNLHKHESGRDHAE